MAESKYCSNCGSEIDQRAEICPKCGVRVMEPVRTASEKNPGLAAILSFLIPGLGQIYNGEIGKGLILLVLAIISAIFITIVIGIIPYIAIWVYGIYDGYETAKKINTGEITV